MKDLPKTRVLRLAISRFQKREQTEFLHFFLQNNPHDYRRLKHNKKRDLKSKEEKNKETWTRYSDKNCRQFQKKSARPE